MAILAYGSLIAQPGRRLEAMTAERRPWRTPFPVEYARLSRRWGWGPVLVIDDRGAPVNGLLLVLRANVTLGAAVAALAAREGSRPEAVVDVPGVPDLTAIAAALPSNLGAIGLDPEALADRAIASIRHGRRNGVAYLLAAVRSGVVTPRTPAYLEAVRHRLGDGPRDDLERLVACAADHRTGRPDGLG